MMDGEEPRVLQLTKRGEWLYYVANCEQFTYDK